jgi:hypothetical protein
VSDSPPPDYVADAVARDQRFAVLAQAIAVETDLRDNETIKAIMGAIRADADQAMEELATTSPADQSAIALLLVRISTLVYIRRTLNIVIRRGQAAEVAIRSEDQARGDE